MLGKNYLPDPSNIFLVELNTFEDINSGCISSRATSQLLHLISSNSQVPESMCVASSMVSKVTIHPTPARKRTGQSKVGIQRVHSFSTS